MRNEILILFVLILSCYNAAGQSALSDETDIIASILTYSDEYDTESVIENLAALSDHPVIINSGDEEEIARLFFLTEFQIKVLADHVMKHGAIATIYEIALLPGFDRSIAVMIAPFIDFDAPGKEAGGRKRAFGLSMASVIKPPTALEPATGVRSVLRMRYGSPLISCGLTAENDPGESFSFSDHYGFDFLSGFLMYKGKGVFNRIIAGDYSLRFGEGLVFNNNSWKGSGLLSPSFMTGRTVVAPYTSAEENNFFRGVAILLGKMTEGAVIFISSNAIDARISSKPDEGNFTVCNLVKGGLHVTPSGLTARNSLTENIAGIHFTAGNDPFRAGLTASYTRFSLPFSPDTLTGEKIDDFRGRSLVNMGADFKAGTGRLLFFSEAGYSIPGSWAALAGVRLAPAQRVTVNILLHHYSGNYYSFHSKSFGAGSAVSNETGIAGNLQVEAAKHLFICAGAEIYSFPWLRYRSSGPSTGKRIEVKCEYIPDDRLSLKVSYTSSDKEYDKAETGISSTFREQKDLINARFVIAPVSWLRLSTRAIFSSVYRSDDKGYLLGQEVMLSFNKIPLKVWINYSLFTTDSYNSRIYCWENDLLQCFNIPALYGDGTRAGVMASWKPSGWLELRIKYAVTASADRFVPEMRFQCKAEF